MRYKSLDISKIRPMPICSRLNIFDYRYTNEYVFGIFYKTVSALNDSHSNIIAVFIYSGVPGLRFNDLWARLRPYMVIGSRVRATIDNNTLIKAYRHEI